jgi:hypothetical protein
MGGAILGVTLLIGFHVTETVAQTPAVVGDVANKTDSPTRLAAFRQGLSGAGYVSDVLLLD